MAHGKWQIPDARWRVTKRRWEEPGVPLTTGFRNELDRAALSVSNKRDAARKADEYRLRFLKSITPTHPLYNSPAARAARGEALD